MLFVKMNTSKHGLYWGPLTLWLSSLYLWVISMSENLHKLVCSQPFLSYILTLNPPFLSKIGISDPINTTLGISTSPMYTPTCTRLREHGRRGGSDYKSQRSGRAGVEQCLLHMTEPLLPWTRSSCGLPAHGQASQHSSMGGHWQGFTPDWGAVDGW